VNVDSLPQSSYPSSPPKDRDSTLTGLHHENTIRLGFWKPETSSLANSALPAEVAKAKSNQQNPSVSNDGGYVLYVWEDELRKAGSCSNPRTRLNWTQHDTRPNGPK
jgi:hypothetical protein